MEFEGRITRVQPARTGDRQDGTKWMELPFVFAYFEKADDRFEDSAMVSTFDTNIMAKIAPYVEKNAEGKVIIENDCAKLTVPHIPVRCGFGHKAKVVKTKDDRFVVINEMRCYKLEVLPAANAAGTVAQPQQSQGAFGQAVSPQSQTVYPPQTQAPFPPQSEDPDDLPF